MKQCDLAQRPDGMRECFRKCCLLADRTEQPIAKKDNGTEYCSVPLIPPSGERSAFPIEAMCRCLPHVWNEPLRAFRLFRRADSLRGDSGLSDPAFRQVWLFGSL